MFGVDVEAKCDTELNWVRLRQFYPLGFSTSFLVSAVAEGIPFWLIEESYIVYTVEYVL